MTLQIVHCLPVHLELWERRNFLYLRNTQKSAITWKEHCCIILFNLFLPTNRWILSCHGNYIDNLYIYICRTNVVNIHKYVHIIQIYEHTQINRPAIAYSSNRCWHVNKQMILVANAKCENLLMIAFNGVAKQSFFQDLYLKGNDLEL